MVGIDPTAASLKLAGRKTGAEKVRWVHGDTAAEAGLRVDLVIMTGNVAQGFVDDEEWGRSAPRFAWEAGARERPSPLGVVAPLPIGYREPHRTPRPTIGLPARWSTAGVGRK